jgi:hypothetical protein
MLERAVESLAHVEDEYLRTFFGFVAPASFSSNLIFQAGNPVGAEVLQFDRSHLPCR